MELILSLLILSVAASACVQVFAAAWQDRRKAREWNHIQELVICASEILEGSDGSPEAFLAHLPGGNAEGHTLTYSYDGDWNLSSPQTAVYQLTAVLEAGEQIKKIGLSFLTVETGEILYQLEVQYPILLNKKELHP